MEIFLNALKVNAEELRRLNRRIHETVAERGKSKEHWAAWKAAATEFHMRWYELAFPGGIRKEIELLRQGDVSASEKALLYLENPPYSFRSQYNATTFRRALNKIAPQLPKDIQQRFDNYKLQVASRKLNKYKKLA